MSNPPPDAPQPSYGQSPYSQPAPQPQGGSNTMVIVLVVLGVFALVGLLACGGVLIGLLLPAVQSARTAARRVQSSNNLKQIGLALHNYHDTHGQLPPAVITDEDGQPLLSWRVALLPYLEQGQLYERFDLTEPWDGPTNGPLLDEMPEVLRTPSAEWPEGQTAYLAIDDPEAAFNQDRPIRFADFADSLGSTVVVIEADTAVPWSAPQDLSMDEAVTEVSSGDGDQVLFGDGSVRHIQSEIDPETARATFTRAGGDGGGF